MRRILPSLLVFVSTLTLAQQYPSLQQDPKVEKAGLGYVVFKQTKESVWTALVETMTSYNWRPQTMDAASGVVFFQSDGKWGSTWGSNNNLVSRFTNKKVSGWSTWQSIAIEANAIVKSAQPYRTEVKVSAKFSGCNGWQAFGNKYKSCKWEPLQSNGALEEELLKRISSNLPELSSAELYPASKPDEKVLNAARAQVISFERVVAAFELNASADRIMTELVNAKASLQTFGESQESRSLPKFTSALNKTIQQLTTAFNGKPEERATLLQPAMGKFAEAKKCLTNYQNLVQESEPSSSVSAVSPSERSVIQNVTLYKTDNAASTIAPIPPQTSPSTISPPAAMNMGITVGRAELEGAAVMAVSSGSIAERAGLHVGDVINFVDETQIKTPEEFTAELSRKRTGTQVRIGWVFRSTALGYIPKSAFLMLGTQAR